MKCIYLRWFYTKRQHMWCPETFTQLSKCVRGWESDRVRQKVKKSVGVSAEKELMAAARKIVERFPNTTSTNNTISSDMLLHSGPCLCCPLVLPVGFFCCIFFFFTARPPVQWPHPMLLPALEFTTGNLIPIKCHLWPVGVDLRRLQQCHSCEKRGGCKLDLVMTGWTENVIQTSSDCLMLLRRRSSYSSRSSQ